MKYDLLRFEDLRKRLEALPRIRLACLPTPLEDAPRLAAALGDIRLLIKRDDLTGLAFGGNKTRMIELRLVEALRRGADSVIAGYGVQSNHARQIAAACARLGLRCHLILKEEAAAPGGNDKGLGNLMLHNLLGATVTVTDAPVREQIAMMWELAHQLRAAGHKPFVTGLDDYELSSAAYALAMIEMCAQFEERGIDPDVVVVCSEGPTQSGLLLAARYIGMKARIVGISPMHRIDRPGREPEMTADIRRLCGLCSRMLGIEVNIRPEDVINTTRFVGEAYGVVSPEALDAIRLAACTEGLILDPVYTGKAMAGLRDMVRTGEIGPGSTVVFIHTGGGPLTFLYGEELVRGWNEDPDRTPAANGSKACPEAVSGTRNQVLEKRTCITRKASSAPL